MDKSFDASQKDLLLELQKAYALIQNKKQDEAFTLAQNCLKQYPQQPDVHYLMSLLQLEQKKYLEAEKSINTAISLYPQKADYYFLLGQILSKMSRIEETENAFRQCLKINSNYYQAHFHLGYIFESQNRLKDAQEAYLQALKIKPDFYRGRYNLGIVYHKRNKIKEAIECYEKALIGIPEDLGLLSNIGAALTRDRQFKRALQFYEKALKIDPNYVPALTNIGGTFIEMNRLDQASAYLYKSLELEPALAPNWRNLTLAVTYKTLETPDLKKITDLMKDPKLSNEEKAHFYFALGKIYHDCKAYDQAFDYYAKGNVLGQNSSNFNAAIFKTHINKVIKFFDKDTFNKIKLAKDIHPQPIIIVGTSRSGKSLIEAYLSQCPHISASGEIGLAEYGSKVPLELLPKGNYPFWIRSLNIDEAKAVKEAYYARLIRDAHSQDKYVMDTIPGNFLYLGLLAMLFPGIKIIYCQRDPIDACLLMYFKYYIEGHGYTYSLSSLGEYYQQFQRMMLHWMNELKLPIFELKYENLINHPKETMNSLLDYLDLNEKPNFDFSLLHSREIGIAKYYAKYLKPLKDAMNAEIKIQGEENEFYSVVRDLLASAYQYYNENDLLAAEKMCFLAIEEDKLCYPAFHLLGAIYFKQEAFQKAIIYYEKAIGLAPNNPQLHFDISNAYQKLNQQMLAEKHLKTAENLVTQSRKFQSFTLDNEQRKELLNAYTLPIDIQDEFETRLLLKGVVDQNLTTDSYMTRSWDQYFHDLSFGSYRTINTDGRHIWHMRTWHFLYKNLALVDQILNQKQATLKILDIGCSTGYFRRFLEGNVDAKSNIKIFYWGLDIREDVLSIAVKGVDDIESGAKGNLVPASFIIHDTKHGLPYQSHFFDYIVNFEMIKYLPVEQGRALLLEMNRVLKKDGLLYLSTSYSSHKPGFMKAVPYEQIEQMLFQSGFKITQRLGSQASLNRLSSYIKEAHLPLVKELLTVHPPEMVAAMITPLYAHCADQVTFQCRIKE